MKIDNSPEIFVFDFRSAAGVAGWRNINDDVMGGVSTSRFELIPKIGAVFSGVVSLENNGGFASVRSAPARQNLDGFTAFRLRARGHGKRYKFTVRTELGFDAPLYQFSFITASGEWREHRLPFADFVPTFRGRVLSGVPPFSAAELTSVSFLIAHQQAGEFRLEIDWIKAVRETR